jgi:hypothetical protein
MNASQYRNFVLEGIKDFQDIFKNVYAGCILGNVKFIKDKLSQLQKDVDSKDFAHKRAIKNIIDPEIIINSVKNS